jgi:SAM-dependent methyltransferase
MNAFKDRIPILLSHIKWKQLAGERPIYIFGSGAAGRLLLEYLRVVEIEPAGMIDNNKEKWGLDFLGLKIFDPEIVGQDIFIIIASSWFKEISEQLLKLGKRKGLDFAADFESWFDTLCKYRFVNSPDLLMDIPACLNRCLEKVSKRKIAVFGGGKFGRDLVVLLTKNGICPVAIFDNDQNKWGQLIEGIAVKGLQSFDKESFILVASTWRQEIVVQLVESGLVNDLDFFVVDETDFYGDVDNQANKIGTNAVLIWDDEYQPKEEVHFFVHNSMHAGDILLTRPFINELRTAFPKARITLECPKNHKYLWEDLKLSVVTYDGQEYQGIGPTPNCPPEAIFLNIWFGVFQDILDAYGLSFANNIHTFNRYMSQYHLQNVFQLSNKEQTPMVEFYRKSKIPYKVREKGVLIENGRVFSGQSSFPLNDWMNEIVRSFPDLNFYFAAPPGIDGPNVMDCSKMDLIDISEVSNRCIGFLTRGSGVNAATLTENNRYKPRCIVGWNYQWKVWHSPENPTFFAENIHDIKRFLVNLAKQQPSQKLPALKINETGIAAKMFCKFLRARTEIEKCTQYLFENGLASHAVVCKDWEIAHIISDLSDGNLLDMGSSDSYILKNAVIKGIKGEKYGIDLRLPNVPLASVKYLIGDLLKVPLPAAYFDNITCLSVLEHGVDIRRFAMEASRLLKEKGTLYVTFDFWDPKTSANMRLYGLEWNIFDRNEVHRLVAECKNQGLDLTEDIDWTVEKPLIDANYWAPAKVGYTFGMLSFTKRN